MSKASYAWRQLPGGPRLAVATVADSECAALSIHIPAGSRDETGEPEGLAHFVEHMVFKGTGRRTARDLSFEIENAGGQVNACTTEERTVYDGRGEADLMPVLADVLCDMVWHASFPEAEIGLEREVIGEEITMYRESPTDHIGDLISKALWAPHSLGNAISGSLESIARIDRAALAGFRDRHYFREDVVIAASGPFSLEEVLALLAPHLPRKCHAAAVSPRFQRLPGVAGKIVERRDTDQLQLALAWHLPGRHDASRHALRLLSLMLGETASSRLFLELREERGLCYQISSDVTLFDDTGALEISAGLDPAAREESLACMFREIEDLAENGPREGELERAQRLVIAQSKIALEGTASQADWAGENVLDFGELPSPQQARERVLAVTREQVRDAARAVFRGQSPAMAEIAPL